MSREKEKVAADLNDTNSDAKADGKADDTTTETTEAKEEVQANGHEPNGDSNGIDVKDEEKDDKDADDNKEDVVKEMEKKEKEMEEKVDKETEAAGDKVVAEEESGDVEEDADGEDVEEDAEEEAESRDQSVADVTMADTTTDSMDVGDSSAFPPGTIVLAKVKGFLLGLVWLCLKTCYLRRCSMLSLERTDKCGPCVFHRYHSYLGLPKRPQAIGCGGGRQLPQVCLSGTKGQISPCRLQGGF